MVRVCHVCGLIVQGAKCRHRPHSCRWCQDDDGTWQSGCGLLFCFDNDGPSENGFRFCPFCGRPMLVG